MTLDLNKNQLRFLMLCIIWGSTWIGTKAGIEVVPPLLFAGTRFTAAGRIAAAIWVGPGTRQRPSKLGDSIRFVAVQYVDDHPVLRSVVLGHAVYRYWHCRRPRDVADAYRCLGSRG